MDLPTGSNTEAVDNVTNEDNSSPNATQEIQMALTKGHQPTPSELLAMVARLQAQVNAAEEENTRLKQTATRSITVKMSEKGGVSVYGIQRFPVTLYQDQWIKLFKEALPLVESFITTHGREGDNTLADRPPKAGRPTGALNGTSNGVSR